MERLDDPRVVSWESWCEQSSAKRVCNHYTPSQFYPDLIPGQLRDGVRCEDLRRLTFADNSIDLHVTQDVLEHVFEPAKVFSEIARTLKPGGAHICTVPLVRKRNPSKLRVSLSDGTVIHHDKPDYHGNPVSQDGSLVVTEWGYDTCNRILESCGLFTYMIQLDAVSEGIRAEYIEVLVTVKP